MEKVVEEQENLFDFDLSSFEEISQQFEEESNEQPIDQEDEVNLDQEEDIIGDDNKQKQIPQEDDEEIKSEEEESKGQEGEENEDPSSKDITDPSILAPYAKLLAEEGILPNLDLEKFDGSVESLLEAQRSYYEESVKSGIEGYKNTLDPRIKWLQDNIENGVPLQDLLEIERDNFVLDNIDENALTEDIEIQKEIIRDFYRKSTSFSEQYIEKEINRMDNLGELEENSKEFLPKLKEINSQREQQLVEQNKAQLQQQEEAQKQVLNSFKETLDNTGEIIPGLRVNDKLKQEIYKTLTTPAGQDEYGNVLNKISKARMENPVDFEIKLAYIYEITKGFSDWSPLTSTGRKQAYKEFEHKASSIDFENRGQFKGSKQRNLQTNSESEFMKGLEEYDKYLRGI